MHKTTKLRIAQVAPLFESVPPKLYGGTERIVSFLTEALVDEGHDVTLYASGDSVTTARLVAAAPQALRLNPNCVDQMAPHINMLQLVQNDLLQYDIVHYHIDYLHFPLSRHSNVPQLTTLHGRLDIPELQPLYHTFSDMPVVSISDNQRKPLPQAHWQGTVYHGLPIDLYKANLEPQGYLAFLGRVSPEKGLQNAIAIAIASNMPLKIAAKVDVADQKYFDQEIKHLLTHPLIEFIGEIGESQKNEFLGNATALLFPIEWEEPFGLVMIEALACGTPVIAYPCGSVPEILTSGQTGFLVNTQDEAVQAVSKISTISRATCREVFEKRFTASRMADDYVSLFHAIMNSKNRNIVLKQFAS